MSVFEGCHRGQRCFLIGSGPSISKMDLTWLRREITICVNQSYKALDFDPSYICIGDRKLWPWIKDVYAQMSSTIICGSGWDGSVGQGYTGGNLGVVVPLDKTRLVKDGHFRHDLERIYPAFNVVPEVALPFVLHTGCAECYLIGCDCTQEGYFYPDAESARPHAKQRVLPRAMASYPVIRDYAEEHGLTRIFNAGVGGRLDVFPRVDFESLKPEKSTTEVSP